MNLDILLDEVSCLFDESRGIYRDHEGALKVFVQRRKAILEKYEIDHAIGLLSALRESLSAQNER